MINTSWITYFAPLLVATLVFILTYISFKKLKIPGSDTTHAVFSAIVALLLVTSKRLVNYSIDLVPWFAVISVIIFLILLLLAFVGAGNYNKAIGAIGFIAAILVVFALLFEGFPTLYHMLPNTSNAYLSGAAIDLKDFIYDNDFLNNLVFVGIIIGVAALVVKK